MRLNGEPLLEHLKLLEPLPMPEDPPVTMMLCPDSRRSTTSWLQNSNPIAEVKIFPDG